jgi:TonB family protein
MKLKRLNFQIGSIITVLTVLILAIACNSDQQEKKSTTGMNENNTGENSGISNSLPTPTTPVSVKKALRMTGKLVAVNETSKVEMDKTGYYTRAEVMPSYRRGKESLDDYILGNLEYPQEAIDNNIEGTVNVGFAVDDNGKISAVKVIGKKIGYGLEDEAVRVISEMPKWNPGQVKGKNVKTRVNLLITYKIEA